MPETVGCTRSRIVQVLTKIHLVHGWDYRRYILNQIASPRHLCAAPSSSTLFPEWLVEDAAPEVMAHRMRLAQEELSYTLSKIESNFSNFSAWHERSLLLPALWEAEHLDAAQCRSRRDEEFQLVTQAMFVDPDDQSVWTYHRWLVSLGEHEIQSEATTNLVTDPAPDVLEREIASIRELLALEPESRCKCDTFSWIYIGSEARLSF